MGLIDRFLLPETVDFDAALKAQATALVDIVGQLQEAAQTQSSEIFESIRRAAEHARALKDDNMKRLLNVFLTPYDKESIYRLLTQLDWAVLSVKHFVIEREVYGIQSLLDYREIIALLNRMAKLLATGVDQLHGRESLALAATTDQILELYDLVVERCARAIASLLESEDCHEILRHRDIVDQLREIAKRLHVAANSLEDMAIKLG